jgi:hypothetical protein
MSESLRDKDEYAELLEFAKNNKDTLEMISIFKNALNMNQTNINDLSSILITLGDKFKQYSEHYWKHQHKHISFDWYADVSLKIKAKPGKIIRVGETVLADDGLSVYQHIIHNAIIPETYEIPGELIRWNKNYDLMTLEFYGDRPYETGWAILSSTDGVADYDIIDISQVKALT